MRNGRYLFLGAVFGALVFAPAAVQAAVATYVVEVNNIWSEATHPGAFPTDAHFSHLGGGTHNGSVSFWNPGELASPGMVTMAETGGIAPLTNEVQTAIDGGNAFNILSWTHWFCPSGTTHANCGAATQSFQIDDAFPLVSLATMLGPSPDWFVGVTGLSLHDGGGWISQVVVDLFPYDGGTRDANAFALFGAVTNPQDVITLITAGSGQLIGPQSLGTMTFTLVPVPAALPLFAAALAGLGLAGRRRPSS